MSGETRASDQALSEREFEELLRKAREIIGNQKTVQPLGQDLEKDDARSGNRRAGPRGALGAVVLVYFGQQNWGRLLNISEGGMALEFDQLPPFGQPISFTLETAGCQPAQLDREPPRNCIQANGQVVWTQEFERVAGVQFLDLASGTQEQIKQWLAASTTTFAEGDGVQPETISSTTQKGNHGTGNRRAGPRGALGVVVLVYFGQQNWGRLLNISEGGMALEFDQLPPFGQPISFTLETVGCRPAQLDREPPRNCIQANGQVVWTQEFQRAAGVQFLDLASGPQEQIKQWLAASTTTLAEGDKIQHDTMVAQSFGPPPTSPETSQVTDGRQQWDSELGESNAEILPEVAHEPEPQRSKEPALETFPMAFAEGDKIQHDTMEQSFGPLPTSPETSQVTDGRQQWDSELGESNAEILPEAAREPEPQRNKEPALEPFPMAFAEGDKVQHETMEAQSFRSPPTSPETSWVTDGRQQWNSELRESSPEELRCPEPREQQKRKERIIRIAFVGASGCLALLAVVASMRMIRSRLTSMSAVTERVRKPSTDKGAPLGTGPRSDTESPLIFQVETVDANKRQRLLRFEDRAVTSATNRIANPPERLATSANRRSLDQFKLATPKAVRAATNASTDDSALAVALVVPTGVLAPPGKPLGGSLADTTKPPSVAPAPPVGGQVQLSPPLSSVSPTYVPLSATFTSENVTTALGVLGSSDEVNGIKIIKVTPNSPAAAAGLAVGDIIMAIDGNVVNTKQSLDAALANRKPGSKVRVTFMHIAWLANTTVTIRSQTSTSDYSFGFLFP
jgi:c-di-GMP-binding flagellar brake protein YcgR